MSFSYLTGVYVGCLVRSHCSLVKSWVSPSHLSPNDGPKIGYNDEVIVLDTAVNMDAEWVRVLCLETGQTGWLYAQWFKVIA